MRKPSHVALVLVVTLLAMGLFLAREYAVTGTFGFPLDDAWIHAQFARNLALGQGFSYNPGVPVSGSTAPLWTFANATGYLVTGDPVLTATVLGVVLLLVSAFFVNALVRVLTGDDRLALFAAVATVALPRLVWAGLSGMEIPLAVALSLAGILAHLLYRAPRDRRQYLSPLLFGLATLARPECGIFFVGAVLDRLLAAKLARQPDASVRDWLMPVGIQVCVFAAVLVPFVAFSKRFGVGVLPNTAYAKAIMWNTGLVAGLATGNSAEIIRSLTFRPFDYVLSFLHESLDSNPVLFALGALGLIELAFAVPFRAGSRARSFILPLAAVLFPIIVGAVVPFGGASYQGGRYAAPMAPLLVVIGTVGMCAAARHAAFILGTAKSLGRPAIVVLERTFLWLLMFLALGAQARGLWSGSRAYALQVANIQDMQVAMAKWIDENVPPDAVVATNDVGAIAYFSRRKILDTVGLISPGVLNHLRPGVARDDAVLAFLEEERPDYAVLFPDWYPTLVTRAALFERVHSVVLAENIICGGDELVAYRLHWDAPRGGGPTPLSDASQEANPIP